MNATTFTFVPPPIPAEPGTPASYTLDHYEHMVECGAFEHGYEKDVELLWGRIVEKHTGKPATYTLDHYEHMVACGAFAPPFDIPVEFLRGDIIMMSPIGEPHSLAVTRLTEWSYAVVDLRRVMIRTQMPIRIPKQNSEPEPDLAWVRRESVGEKPPEPKDVLLLIEVADSSLAYDRGSKLADYAQASIQDYWIVNLIDQQVEVYRQPQGMEYVEKQALRGDDAVSPLALPSVTITASELLAKPTG